MKICNKCKEEKPLDKFYPRNGVKDGRSYSCRKCTNIYNKKWRSNVGDYASRQKKYKIKELYGLSEIDYNELTKNGCEVCGSMGRLHIDHDHNCCPGRKTCGNCIRGVLCGNCNHAEGQLKSNPEIILALYRYVRRNQNTFISESD